LQSFCTACGSTEPSSTGRRRRLPHSNIGDHGLPATRREKSSLPGRCRWGDRPIFCERPKGRPRLQD
jgi:hypothetical protein